MCDMEYNCGDGDQSDEDKCEEFVTAGWDSTGMDAKCLHIISILCSSFNLEKKTCCDKYLNNHDD